MKQNESHDMLDACPAFESLVDFADGEIEATERSGMLGHLSRCPDCASIHRRIRQTTSLMRETAGILAFPPQETERLAVEVGRTLLRERRMGGREVIVARLVRSGPVPVQAGIRGAVQSVRQLHYETDLFDLRVELRPGFGGSVRVRGHAYPRTEDPLVLQRVLLRRDGGGPEVDAKLSGERGFRVSELPPGDYSLQVRLEGRCIHFPDFRARD